jgi:predicted permease
MRIPLREGRIFGEGDTADSAPAVVIDELLARRYFKDRSPLGQQIQRGGPDSPRLTIVGVVGTINSIDLAQPVEKERIYYPVTQQPRPGMAIVLKTSLDPEDLVGQLRAAVQSLDPEQPIADVRTMEGWMDRSLEGRRAPMVLFGLFGVVALVLSAIGIYGVLAFNVSQRVRELGIRQALGADSAAIQRLVLKSGVLMTGTGLVAGLAASYALTKYLQALLFGVDGRDWSVFSAVTVLLFAVAMLACYLPARRATRIDPMTALRET